MIGKESKKVKQEDKRGLKNKGGNKRSNEELPEGATQSSKQAKINHGDNSFAAIGDQMDIVPVDSSDETVLSEPENCIGRREDSRKEDPTRRKEDATRNEEPTSAKINLETNKNLEKIKQLLLTSIDNDRKLTTYSPIKIEEAIHQVCGEVELIDYQKSGSILVIIKHHSQIQELRACKELPILKIPIQVNIAWTTHFTYGKLWAPEFMRDSLQEILEYFEKFGVVAVRKLYNDLKRAHQPYYVFTFLGPIPDKITLGRHKEYRFENYYPNPLQCRNCWRLGHMTKTCKSSTLCSKCTSPEHHRNQCTAEKLMCINCKGEHEASDRKKECPKYLREKEICKIVGEQGVGFPKAREILQEKERRDSHHEVDVESHHQFPRLPQPRRPTQSQSNIQSQSNFQPQSNFQSQGNFQSQSNNITPTNFQSQISFQPQPYFQPQTYSQQPQQPNDERTQPFARILRRTIGNQQSQSYQITAPATTSPKTNSTHSEARNSTPTNQAQEEEYEASIINSLTKNLPEILLYLVKIALANTTTDRIAHLIAIGRIIGLESTISEIINSISSSSSSDGSN